MSDPIAVRATVNLAGLPAGTEALVDPDDPFIALCLERRLLVPLPPAPAAPSSGDRTMRYRPS